MQGLDVHVPKYVRKGFVRIEDAFGPGEHTIFAIDEGGHAYLIGGGSRFDGGILATVEVHDHAKTLNVGTWYKFEGLPPELVEKLRKQGERRFQAGGLTCYAGACNTLEKVGIYLDGPRGSVPEIVQTMLTKGFVDENGNHFPAQVFVSDASVLPRLLEDQAGAEKIDAVGKAAAKVVLVVVGGTVIVASFETSTENPAVVESIALGPTPESKPERPRDQPPPGTTQKTRDYPPSGRHSGQRIDY